MENENWNKICAHLSKEISQDDFEMWIRPIELISFTESELIVSVQNSFFRDNILNRFKTKIESAIKKLFKLKVYIEVRIAKNSNTKTNHTSKKHKTAKVETTKQNKTSEVKYSFKNFITGPNNELAYAAAKRISNSPGEQYNPFFYYGNTGLGKTHLLQAISYEAKKKNADLNIIYVTSEKFLDEFVNAIQKKRVNQFRAKYRPADILLIDDVHFYEGKDGIQNELFNTFNLLIHSKKQMVFTSDRPPKELRGVEERLIGRFSQGLVADIKPPLFETRKAILKQKMVDKKIKIEPDVLTFLAENITTNVRTLEGAVEKIELLQNLKNRLLNVEEVRTQLEDVLDIGNIKKLITGPDILREIADYYSISVGDLKSKSRKKNIAKPRQMGMYLMRELTSLSLIEIGYEFGGRNHATVVHACSNISGELKSKPSLRTDYEQLYKRLSK